MIYVRCNNGNNTALGHNFHMFNYMKMAAEWIETASHMAINEIRRRSKYSAKRPDNCQKNIYWALE